jgi:hypothetical protein
MAESYLIQKLLTSGGGSFDYANITIQDENGAKYVPYNGYDVLYNLEPDLKNFKFNKWILNNSSTGNVILTNVVMKNVSTFSGNGTTFTGSTPLSTSIFDFVLANTNSYLYQNNIYYQPRNGNINMFDPRELLGGTRNVALTIAGTQIRQDFSGIDMNSGIVFNNGFMYLGVAHPNNASLRSIFKTNIKAYYKYVSRTPGYGGNLRAIAVNNGFLYAVGENGANSDIRKYNEQTLAFVGNSQAYGSVISSINIYNGNIYIGGEGVNNVQKFNESTLSYIGASANFGGNIRQVEGNNGFIYVYGNSSPFVRRYTENTLEQNRTYADAVSNLCQFTIHNGLLYLPYFRGYRTFRESNNQSQSFDLQGFSGLGTFVNTPHKIHVIEQTICVTSGPATFNNQVHILGPTPVTQNNQITIFEIDKVKEV